MPSVTVEQKRRKPVMPAPSFGDMHTPLLSGLGAFLFHERQVLTVVRKRACIPYTAYPSGQACVHKIVIIQRVEKGYLFAWAPDQTPWSTLGLAELNQSTGRQIHQF